MKIMNFIKTKYIFAIIIIFIVVISTYVFAVGFNKTKLINNADYSTIIKFDSIKTSTNYKGNIDVEINFTNISNKDIKEIFILFNCYDSNNIIIKNMDGKADSVGGDTTKDIIFKPNIVYNYKCKDVWYQYTDNIHEIDHAKFISAIITYTDNTMFNIR